MPIWRTTVTLDHASLGGTGTNTWHVRTTSGGPSGDTELGLLTAILEEFYENKESILAGSTIIRFNGEWTAVAEEDPEINTSQDPFEITVGGSAAAMPPANALVVGWRTALASRSGKGRTFMGPMAQGAANGDGTVEDTMLNALQDHADTLVESSDSLGNGAFGVFSVKDQELRDFTQARVRDQFAVLRSRRD